MNPGATTRPSASIVRAAGPLNLPISTILPSLIPTSPRNAGIPEPSTMRPLRINRSYAIAAPFPIIHRLMYHAARARLAGRNRRHGLPPPHDWVPLVDRPHSKQQTPTTTVATRQDLAV